MYTLEELRDKTFKELKAIGWQLNVLPDGDKRCRQNWVDAIVGVRPPLLQLLEAAPADSEHSPGAIEVQRQEPIENSPGVEVEPAQESIEHLKFGRITYSRAGVQIPETLNCVEDRNNAEPNGTGTGQIGADEIAIGPGIHQQCLNTAQPDGGNDGTQTETLGSQEGDRILAAAGNGQAVKRRPLPRESNELVETSIVATFNDEQPPNRGDNGRDRLESEPILSQSAIELVAKNSRSAKRSKSSTAHQLLELFKSSVPVSILFEGCANESSNTCEFLIPVFGDRANGRTTDNDEPPTAGAAARRPPSPPPSFGPVMVIANDRSSIKKFARRAIHSSGRAPPGGDALPCA